MDDATSQQPRPHAIHGVLGEPGILRRRQPLGELDPRILFRTQLQDFTAQHLGFDELLGARMPNAAIGIEVDDLLFPLVGRLDRHLGKECRHGEVVIERPGLGWMDVAANAVEPGPHKHQGGRLRKGLRSPARHGPEEIHGRTTEVAAVRCEQLANELIVRLVGQQRLAQPTIVYLHRFRPHVDRILALDPQQVTPLDAQ